MGSWRESVIDWLVLGLMMRILIGAIFLGVLGLWGMSVGKEGGRKWVKEVW